MKQQTKAQTNKQTREKFITALCAAEGGKRQALDAPQAREVLAKMRRLLGEQTCIDLYDLIHGDYNGEPCGQTQAVFKYHFKKKW